MYIDYIITSIDDVKHLNLDDYFIIHLNNENVAVGKAGGWKYRQFKTNEWIKDPRAMTYEEI